MTTNLDQMDNFQRIFRSFTRRQFEDLLSLEPNEGLLPVLPSLCRMILLPTAFDSILGPDVEVKLRAIALDFPRTNTLVNFMSVDFAVLESDLRKDVKLRKKALHASTNGATLEALLSSPAAAGVGQRFESGDASEKFRLLLSELLTTHLFLGEFKSQPRQQPTRSRAGTSSTAIKTLKRFEPLDNEAYVGDCSDLLVIFLAERPALISIEDLCETLTCYRNGSKVIRSLIVNFPDAWRKVCWHFIDDTAFGQSILDDRSSIMQKRLESLNLLCGLDNVKAIDIINHCVEKKKLRVAASLAVRFLPSETVVPFISGVLATADDHHRLSLTSFIHSAQKDWPILREVNVPKTTKRSISSVLDTSKSSASLHDRAQCSEADEAMYEVIGRNLGSIIDLRSIRELWEQDSERPTMSNQLDVSPDQFADALREASRCSSAAISLLRRVLRSSQEVKISYLKPLVKSLPSLLEPAVPPHVLQLACRLWFKMEVLDPRNLYVLTIASLLPSPSAQFSQSILWTQRTTHLELCRDPLTILRCDDRIFRCAPMLKLILRILHCYLAASRAYLQRQLSTTATTTNVSNRRSAATTPVANQQPADSEREELMRSLIGAQESAAVQILLEACLPLESEREISDSSSLREIRGVICSFVHQLFISDPILSKLVHFQTYPSDLVPVAVAGIPSMHICLDFVPELLAQPVQTKRVFAIDLLSHLCEHYAIPKALSIARLAVNVLSTIIGVVPSRETITIFSGLLPALLRIARVFPPLSADVASLLVQVGRICRARLAANDNSVSPILVSQPWPNLAITSNEPEAVLLKEIGDVFRTQLSDLSLEYSL